MACPSRRNEAPSQIIWRRFARERATLDQGYFDAAVARAKARRDALGSPWGEVRRLVWSEADDLPGVVVDQYGDTVVVQGIASLKSLRSGT